MNERGSEGVGVTEVNVAYPEAPDLHLRLAVGACRLILRPSEGGQWVQGSYRYPAGTLPAKIEESGGTVRISQELRVGEWLGRVPVPTFELGLGKARAFALTVETGASEADLDLGGVPVSRLTIKQGAGKIGFDFSKPNPERLVEIDLDAGAGAIEMRNLANANFTQLSVDGGAAGFKFDFGGTLQRDAQVRINVGVCGVEIRIPAATATKVTTESALGGVDVGDGFMKKEGAFVNEAAVSGSRPLLAIRAKVAVGGISIRQT